MVLQSIFLNSQNVVYNSDEKTFNKLKFKFSTPVEFKNNAKISLGSLNLYYSWFNISKAYNNNSFSYIFRGQSRTFTLSDGNYSVDEMNELFMEYMRSQGHYTYNSTSNVATYYASLSANASLYSIQMDFTLIPTSASTSSSVYKIPTYTNALNVQTAYYTAPTVAETMQIVINDNNFTKIIGFNAATYPPTVETTNKSYISTFTPQVNPISAIVITNNLVKQKYTTPNNIFYTFGSGGQAFGDQIKIEPNEYQYCDVANGVYEYIELIFYDQLNRAMEFRDEEVIVNLLIQLNDDK